jgi:uncharacterized protein YjiS (DUF1127 family)
VSAAGIATQIGGRCFSEPPVTDVTTSEMTMSTPLSAHATAGQPRARRLTAILRRWWAAYERRRVERLAIACLEAMTDRQLKDIGVTRSQIEFAVRGEPHRDRIISRLRVF